MLYIDPATCIDCGACVDECPVDAILSEDELEDPELPYLSINAAYYEQNPVTDPTPKHRQGTPRADRSGLKVAIVGSGPAACYAAAELMANQGVEVNMFERLPTPFGLIRSGVAPDHNRTKAVTDTFRPLWTKPGMNLHLSVEIGTDLVHQDLLDHHHAVIYASGASADRRLQIPGEDLPGSHSATEFIAWYNGHPDFADRTFDLSGQRAVVIGNGNVALDVARILVSDIDTLAATDIADHALETLRRSNIREVVVIGRRGPGQSAFTSSELVALSEHSDADIGVENTGDMTHSGELDASVRIKTDLIRRISEASSPNASKRVTLRYYAAPIEIIGSSFATGVRLIDTAGGEGRAESETLEAGLLLRSIGYCGQSLPNLPFDEQRGTIPNDRGRVVDSSSSYAVGGTYVTGWIKRGPSGGIGTNKFCAQETVTQLLEDFDAGLLINPPTDSDALAKLLLSRCPEAIDYAGWMRIDKAEQAAGSKQRRPRVKFVEYSEMIAVAHGTL